MLTENLKFLRKESNLNQAEILDFIGIDGKGKWSDYERGKANPPINILIKISEKFRISLDDLIKSDLQKARFNLIENDIKNDKKGKVFSKVDGKVYQENEHFSLVSDTPNGYNSPKVITVDTEGNENVLYVPVKARAGYLSGLADPSFLGQLPAYRLPGLNNGSFRIFEVQGTSMFPSFQDKDKVICRWESIDNIRDNRCYVVVTANDGLLVKRLINRASDGVIICKSDNNNKGEYPPIVLELSEILEVWYITDRWTKHMGEPGEIYQKMTDMEARLIMLEQIFKKLT